MPDKTISLTLYRELMEDREWLKHLKEDAYKVDESHYDECEKLKTEIAYLKQDVKRLEKKLLMRGVN